MTASFRFQPFQREDLARAALSPGCILSWDTGLGKTVAAFTLPFLKLGWDPALRPRGAVLLVAPGGLHAQITEEGRRLFRQEVVPLDKPAFLRRRRWDPSRRAWGLPPGFYLTSYTRLGRNDAERPPQREEPAVIAERLGLRPADLERLYLESFAARAMAHGEAILEGHLTQAPVAWADLPEAERRSWAEHLIRERLQACLAGVSLELEVERPHAMRCVWDTTLADEAMDAFDCVVVDEGTRIKGESFLAAGVFRLRPQYRYVLTATPIKNRLPDFFQLAWWVCGGTTQANARFPWRPEDKAAFAETFCQSMTQIDPRTGRRKRGGWRRLTPQVCQVHALWKLNGAVVIRRRKKDSGVIIPPKHRHVIRVPMGREQAREYEHTLRDPETTAGAKLTALRQVSAQGLPKLLVALSLVEQVLRQGRQVMVFSAFNAPLSTLYGYLRQAGVEAAVLTHERSEAQRGAVARRFQAGPGPEGLPVVLAGIECMSEGYNFPRCQQVVFLDYSLSADKMRQAEDRVHRLTSREEVHSWRILADGSVDRALEALDAEKGDAAELVLDGTLLTQVAEEVSPAAILRAGEVSFATELLLQDEEEARRTEWPPLRERLALAMATWPGAQATPEAARLAELLELAALEV